MLHAICPNCGEEARFYYHGGYTRDADPRWEEWYTCALCGEIVDEKEMDKVNDEQV